MLSSSNPYTVAVVGDYQGFGSVDGFNINGERDDFVVVGVDSEFSDGEIWGGVGGGVGFEEVGGDYCFV